MKLNLKNKMMVFIKINKIKLEKKKKECHNLS